MRNVSTAISLGLLLVLAASACNSQAPEATIVSAYRSESQTPQTGDVQAPEPEEKEVTTRVPTSDVVSPPPSPVLTMPPALTAQLVGKSWGGCNNLADGTSVKIGLFFKEAGKVSQLSVPYSVANCTPSKALMANAKFLLDGATVASPTEDPTVWNINVTFVPFVGQAFTQMKLSGGLLTLPLAAGTGTSDETRTKDFTKNVAFKPQADFDLNVPCTMPPPRSSNTALGLVDFAIYNSLPGKTVKVYFVDSAGRETLYQTMTSENAGGFPSDLSHKWVIRDELGNCMKTFTAVDGFLRL